MDGMQAGIVADTRPSGVAVVGNAPGMTDQGRRIDTADWVVRFNNAAGFNGHAGRRATHLALVNHGGQMREWLDDPGFTDRPVVRTAGSFLFPFPRKEEPVDDRDPDGRDWTSEAQARLRPLGVTFAFLDVQVHREAAAILRMSSRPDAVPSTGFLVVLHLLGTLPPSVAVGIHGFGFEGWKSHHWQAERQWFETMQDVGRLELHALDASLEA